MTCRIAWTRLALLGLNVDAWLALLLVTRMWGWW